MKNHLVKNNNEELNLLLSLIFLKNIDPNISFFLLRCSVLSKKEEKNYLKKLQKKISKINQKIAGLPQKLKGNRGFCKKAALNLRNKGQNLICFWKRPSVERLVLLRGSTILLRTVAIVLVSFGSATFVGICLKSMYVPAGRYLLRASTRHILAYVQDRKLSKKERAYGLLALFGVVLIHAVVEKTYEFAGPSIHGYFLRGTVRNMARANRYNYMTNYLSYEIAEILPWRIPVVSEFLDAAQTDEGMEMATLLGLRGMFDLLKVTPYDIFIKDVRETQKQVLLIHVLMGKWSTP